MALNKMVLQTRSVTYKSDQVVMMFWAGGGGVCNYLRVAQFPRGADSPCNSPLNHLLFISCHTTASPADTHSAFANVCFTIRILRTIQPCVIQEENARLYQKVHILTPDNK